MLKVGITGGLASGKTTVAKIFKSLGGCVFDADKIAHRAIFKGTSCYRKVVRTFGESILNADQSINRRKLGEIAFGNKVNYRKLCSIIHPWLFEEIKRKISKVEKKEVKKVILLDAAVLIESGFYKNMDALVVVNTTRTQQLERAQKNRNIILPQLRQRMKFQLSLDKKLKFADYVIDNRGSLTKTKAQVEKLWREFKKR